MKKIVSVLISLFFIVPEPLMLFAAEEVNLDSVRVSAESVYIKLDKPAQYKTIELKNPPKIVIDLENTRVKTLQDMPVNGTFLKRVRTGQFSSKPDIARIVLDLTQKTAYDIVKKADELIVVIGGKLSKNRPRVKDTPQDSDKKDEIPVISPDSVNEESEYKELKKESELAPVKRAAKPGNKVQKSAVSRSILDSLPKEIMPSFEYSDADIKGVLDMIASRANINIIYADDVSGTISISLKNVPVDEAFRTVLGVKGLAAQQVGDNILRIATPQTFASEQKKAMLQTRVFFLNYTKVADIKTQIESIAAAEGRTTAKCNSDETNNALIVTDTPFGMETTARIIKSLDRMPRQVLIEAKLVEVSLDNSYDLGIQWSMSGSKNGNYMGANDIGSVIGPTAIYGGAKSIVPNYDASIAGTYGNLSATKGGTGVELGANNVYGAFRLGRVTSNFMFDAVISAAAKKGKAKVLSNPKVATINNKEANINITTQIPYATTETTGSTPPVLTTKVVFIETGIILKVTPTITSDGKISMRVNPSVSQPSPTITVVSGAPGIDKRSADTNVIVQDGETIVIGGLIYDTQSDYVFKIPLLGDIPILGALFRKKSTSRTRQELLIFVTPRIIEG